MSEWIDVDDESPEKNLEILLTDGLDHFLGWFLAQDLGFADKDGRLYDITHWQKLQLPKDTKQ